MSVTSVAIALNGVELGEQDINKMTLFTILRNHSVSVEARRGWGGYDVTICKGKNTATSSISYTTLLLQKF